MTGKTPRGELLRRMGLHFPGRGWRKGGGPYRW